MTDRYFARIVELQQTLVAEAADPHAPGDRELIARLTARSPAEVAYAAPDADVRDDAVPRDGGSVRVRIYRPQVAGSLRPLLVWCHGGAFLGGDLDMPEADAVARELTARAGVVVVSVDYRLCVSGLHFPAPNDDLTAVFDWALRHAAELGADPTRVSIGGASAGAALAAGVALRLRDRASAQPVSVILAYPVVHPTLPTPSPELAAKLTRLTPSMAFAPEIFGPVLENYLGCPAAEAPAHATPGVASDLSGLPPTLIVNCEYDGLRASGEAYAEQLRAAGVALEEHLVEDVLHGHLNRPGTPGADRSLADLAGWLVRDGAGVAGAA